MADFLSQAVSQAHRAHSPAASTPLPSHFNPNGAQSFGSFLTELTVMPTSPDGKSGPPTLPQVLGRSVDKSGPPTLPQVQGPFVNKDGPPTLPQVRSDRAGPCQGYNPTSTQGDTHIPNVQSDKAGPCQGYSSTSLSIPPVGSDHSQELQKAGKHVFTPASTSDKAKIAEADKSGHGCISDLGYAAINPILRSLQTNGSSDLGYAAINPILFPLQTNGKEPEA
jgi:hypothetical protein